MRESGFDVTFRFGPLRLSKRITTAPLCLNSLLYKTETDLAEMSRSRSFLNTRHSGREKARQRREKLTNHLWNERRGEFLDYNFVTHEQSSYEYATTSILYGLDLASKEHAQAVAANLPRFEQPGGLCHEPL